MKHMLWSGGSLDAETALNLIEAVLTMYREERQDTAQDGIPASEDASRRAITAPKDHRPVVTTIPVSPEPRARKLPARTTYSLVVKDGRALNLNRPTPATLKIVEYLHGKRDVTMDRLVEGTGLQPSTISNILVDLRKQGVLHSGSLRLPAETRP